MFLLRLFGKNYFKEFFHEININTADNKSLDIIKLYKTISKWINLKIKINCEVNNYILS